MTSHSTSTPMGNKFKGKVLVRKPVFEYSSNGEDKQSLTVGISTGEKLMKVICYKRDAFTKLVVNQDVILYNVISRKENGVEILVVTSKSKVGITGGLVVPEDHQRCLEDMLSDRDAEVVSVMTALRSPPKHRTSIAGRIVKKFGKILSPWRKNSEEETAERQVAGRSTAMKEITIEDGSGRAKVTLWRKSTEYEARVGDHVNVTNLVINNYRGQVSLNGTGHTRVKVSEAPVEAESVSVEGIDIEDDYVTLFLEDDRDLKVPAGLLEIAMNGQRVESLTSNGPVMARVHRQGSEVREIELNPGQ